MEVGEEFRKGTPGGSGSDVPLNAEAGGVGGRGADGDESAVREAGMCEGGVSDISPSPTKLRKRSIGIKLSRYSTVFSYESSSFFFKVFLINFLVLPNALNLILDPSTRVAYLIQTKFHETIDHIPLKFDLDWKSTQIPVVYLER